MTRCIRCRATVTNLSLIPVIEGHFNGSYSGRKAYELSTYGSTLLWLKRCFGEVVTSEYIPGQLSGAVVDGIRNEDVQALTFEDNSFDVVCSNQVFEHVPDDIKGFSECHRVLKAGGMMVMSVPLFDIPSTQKIAQLSGGALEFLAEPEFHDSRIGGVGSAPVFWHHSMRDLSSRVLKAGFSKAELIPVNVVDGLGVRAKILYAVK